MKIENYENMPDAEKISALENALSTLEGVLLTLEAAKVAPITKVRKSAVRYYRILNEDVTFSKAPQLVAIAEVLKHFGSGAVVPETDIVVQLEGRITTKMGTKAVFDYYKGNHPRGLVQNGNIEPATMEDFAAFGTPKAQDDEDELDDLDLQEGDEDEDQDDEDGDPEDLGREAELVAEAV